MEGGNTVLCGNTNAYKVHVLLLLIVVVVVLLFLIGSEFGNQSSVTSTCKSALFVKLNHDFTVLSVPLLVNCVKRCKSNVDMY